MTNLHECLMHTTVQLHPTETEIKKSSLYVVRIISLRCIGNNSYYYVLYSVGRRY